MIMKILYNNLTGRFHSKMQSARKSFNPIITVSLFFIKA